MRHLRYCIGFALVAIIVLLNTSLVFSLATPPSPTGIPIVDQTRTLTTEQTSNLAATIAEERSKSSNQVAIVIIPTLAGDSLEDYSLRLARNWGIGGKDKNNGVLLLVVKEDRKLRIEVGYGLEGALTDARASQIIRNRITPEFKQGKYYEGINGGLEGIIAAIHNEYDPAVNANTKTNLGAIPWESILFGIFIIPIWVSSILARSKSWWAGGAMGGLAGTLIGVMFGFIFIGTITIIVLIVLGLLLDWVVSNNYRQHRSAGRTPSWWAGGTRIGGGSGGFGGFGGGSFGGGGSSGSW